MVVEMKEHGNKKHGMSHSRPWVIWTDMKRRCNNDERASSEFYKNKGITYQLSWENFENFWEDMKETYQDDLTLDRIDPSGNYTVDNCRWMTIEDQQRNKTLYKSNKLGVAGCYLSKSRGVDILVCGISDKGKVKRKVYSLNKYTISEALILATEWREQMKIILGYSEHHGKCV